MSYAIISDIHGNLQAMEAVLADIESRGIDKIYCLGDIVGYGADPHACIDIVRERGIPCVMGNHDFAAGTNNDRSREMLSGFRSEALEAIQWTKGHLSSEQLAFLFELPYTRKLSDSIIISHANIVKPEGFEYIDNRFFAGLNLDELKTGQILFVGHTHVYGGVCISRKTNKSILKWPKREIGVKKYAKCIFNAGAVGQPRDGNPDACYVVFDDEKMSVRYRRVKYDIEEAAKRIMDAGLPEFLADRLYIGR